MNKYLVYFNVCVLALALYACPSGGKEVVTAEVKMATQNYADAAKDLKEEYLNIPKDSIKRKAKVSFLLGECYKLSNSLQEAEKWYKEAISYDIIPEAKYGYADVLKRNGKYYQAIEVFQEFLDENPEQKHRADHAIYGCNLAIDWMNEPSSEYDLYKPQGFNSEFSDYAPSFFGNQLVFSSHRASNTGVQVYGRTGEKFSDIYISKLDGEGKPQPPLLLDEKTFNINTKSHEGASSFSSDSSEIFFTRCGDEDKIGIDYCELYYSKRNSDGTFEEPQLMNLFRDTAKFNVGQPSLSSDGYKLYFSASVPHKGYGGKDIYVCERINDQWSIPENLGPEINTPGDESFPFAYKDDMLYFSSDGHIGMGGMDVYEARKKGRKWEIRNMQYPLNTGADDFGLVLQDTEILSESGYYVTRGFFSSSRKDGLGSDDIYGLRMRKDAFYFLNVVVLEKVLMNPDDPKSKVIDLAPVRNTKVQIYANDTLVEIGKTNESGILRYKLRPNKEYKVLATKIGFLNKSDYVPPVNYQTNQSNKIIHVDLELILDHSFAKDQFIKIDNIYYDFDAWYIREDAAYELDSLSNLLKDNPQLAKVEIGSHTDSRGSYAYNEKLSQKRAESCVRYLVSKGVDKTRLIAKGYGESELMNNCDDAHECSEDKHQRNRRTTFRIITEDYDIISVDPADIYVDKSAELDKNEREAMRQETTTDGGDFLKLFAPPSNKKPTTPTTPPAAASASNNEIIDTANDKQPQLGDTPTEPKTESVDDILGDLNIQEDDTPIDVAEENNYETLGVDDGFEPITDDSELAETDVNTEEATALPSEEEQPIKMSADLLTEEGEVMESAEEGEIVEEEAPIIEDAGEVIEKEPSDKIIAAEEPEEEPLVDLPESLDDISEDEVDLANDINDEESTPIDEINQDLDLMYPEVESELDTAAEYEEEDTQDYLMIEEEFMEETVLECEIGAKFKEKKDFIIVLVTEDTLINQLVDKDLFKMYSEGDKVIYTSSGMWGDFTITKKE